MWMPIIMSSRKMKYLTQFKRLCSSTMINFTWLMIIIFTATMGISCNSNEEEKIPEKELNVTSLPLLEPTKTPVLKPTTTITPTPKPPPIPTSTAIPTITPVPELTPTPTSIPEPKPEPKPKPILNLIDVLKIMNLETNGDYSVFSNFLKNSELENEISTRDQVTLFIPTNSALEILKIYLSEDEIKNVLEMHILPFKFKEKDIKKISHLDTLNGDSINIEVTDRKAVIISNPKNKISILKADISIQNGYIHVIDSVILPNNISSWGEYSEWIDFELFKEKIINNNLRVENFKNKDSSYNFNENFTLTINFNNEGKYSGKYLCNNIFGNYEFSEDTYLKVSKGASTKMFCNPPSDDVEKNTEIIWDFMFSEDLETRISTKTEGQFFFSSPSGSMSLIIIPEKIVIPEPTATPVITISFVNGNTLFSSPNSTIFLSGVRIKSSNLEEKLSDCLVDWKDGTITECKLSIETTGRSELSYFVEAMKIYAAKGMYKPMLTITDSRNNQHSTILASILIE